jgi:RNA polymerase sigma-70 factor (ECF subfamily)
VNEPDLLERLRAGDASAFDTLFRQYYGRLVGLAESILRDRAAAEEIGQEVMLELWRRRMTLQLDAPLHAYLFRAARNRALNEIRHARVVRNAEPFAAQEATPSAPADREVQQAEIDRALAAAVAELPPRCREVFELSRVHGLSYAEIATTMEISVKTVEAQMGKALRVLRERLAPWLPPASGL